MNIKITSIISLTLGILLVASCSVPLLVPTENDASRAQIKWNDENLAALQHGHQLYINKCGKCHYLYRPNKLSDEQWQNKLDKMSLKAKLTIEEKELILRYLITMRDSYVQQEQAKK